jgi:hypothetical protein
MTSQNAPTILKASGEFEDFSIEKFKKSLAVAGAPENIADEIAQEINNRASEFTSTEQIHDFAFRRLQDKFTPVADRYNLKRALAKFGPSGYPFEKYIAKLYEAQGYKAQTNRVLQGQCVEHEVDVVIERDGQKKMVEVKFHNSHGNRSGVQVSLYVKSRFDDIVEGQLRRGETPLTHAIIATNTSFSHDAATYAACKDIETLAWEGGQVSLAERINKLGLHPVTAMSLLKPKELMLLLNKGIVLCAQVASATDELREAGVEDARLDLLKREAEAISKLQPIM